MKEGREGKGYIAVPACGASLAEAKLDERDQRLTVHSLGRGSVFLGVEMGPKVPTLFFFLFIKHGCCGLVVCAHPAARTLLPTWWSCCRARGTQHWSTHHPPHVNALAEHAFLSARVLGVRPFSGNGSLEHSHASWAGCMVAGGEIRKRAVLFGIHAKSGAFLSMLRAGKRVHDTLQIAKGMDHIVQCGQGNCGSAAL
eukprot:1162014-Pelagomonas_calceolata.AAC.12